MNFHLNQKGQFLLEILVAVLIAALIIGAASGLMMVSLRSGQNAGEKNSALLLAQEGLEAIESIRDASWHNIYLPPDGNGNFADKGNAFPYYVRKNGFSWELSNNAADRDVLIDGKTYSRTVYVYNVNRDSAGYITEIGGMEDPSTQKIEAVISYDMGSDLIIGEYISRWKNEIFIQSDWSGGPGQTDFSDSAKYDSDDGNVVVNNPSGSIKLEP